MQTRNQVDAVVVGGGHHGLVAATALADAGWDVVVLEAADEVGGAVRSAELVPGYACDLFSAFYPLAAASPVLQALDLGNHGLRWSRAPLALGHPRSPDGTDAAVIHPDPADTAAALGDPRDGEQWLRLCEQWQLIRQPLLHSIFATFPPVRGPLALLRTLGTAEAVRFARFLALPVHRMGQELFRGEAGRRLLTGNAMHADVPPEAPVSGVFGWLLSMLAQDVGFPVPVGGAGELAAALAARARAAGVRIHTGQRVERIIVRDGRAVGARSAAGLEVRARRAVIADTPAPTLYDELLAPEDLPGRLRTDLTRFQWDHPVVKLDWALSKAIPWRAEPLAGAGTVHLGPDSDGAVHWSAELATGVLPTQPFVLFGQMTTADASRSPAGTESAWAYTHLPYGVEDDHSAEVVAQRVDELLEAHAPGFRDRVVERRVQLPAELGRGPVNSGTAQLHQQGPFRPVPGLGGPETPIGGLYLGSASAHPGGGVHGACGWNAARAALTAHRPRGFLRNRAVSGLLELLYRDE